MSIKDANFGGIEMILQEFKSLKRLNEKDPKAFLNTFVE